MSRKLTASVCGLAFAALIVPAFGQQSGTSGTSGAADQTATEAGGSETAGAGDAQQAAMQKAEQVGIQNARAVDGAFVLEGSSPTATPMFLIVGPTGDLLAIATPLAPMPAATQGGSGAGQSGTSTSPQAGQPAQSGFMATQTSPASPDMWDPVAVENAMQSLELGASGAAGQVPAQ